MAWLERSIDHHWGLTKYMRVAAEKLALALEFLPSEMVIVLDSLGLVAMKVTSCEQFPPK